MNDRVQKRLLNAWLVLCAITLTYLAIDHSARNQGDGASMFITTTAIIIALVKVRIIMREFMDVRHAPSLLGHITDAIVGLMAVVLIGCYIAGNTVG